MVDTIWRWAKRTPVQSFILCPIAIIVVELLQFGKVTLVPWGAALLVWGYLQYRLTGNYRHPLAGGSSGMTTPPDRLIESGPYRFTRNPMYLGLVLVTLGIALCAGVWPMFLAPVATFATANWAHIPFEEAKMRRQFGADFEAYTSKVRRWI